MIPNFKDMISPEELKSLYIDQNLSTRQIAKKFNVGATTVKKYVKLYNLTKSKEQQKLSMIQSVKKTNLERYGVESFSQRTDVKEKIKQTFKNRYDGGHPMRDKKVKKKHKQSCLENLGFENALQSPEILQKIKQTNLSKYGYEHYTWSYDTKDRQEKIKAKFSQTILEKYGVPYYCMTEECQEAHGRVISKLNLFWKEEIEKLGYKIDLEKHINAKSYDIYILNTNILLEINPTSTHNSTINIFSESAPAKSQDYHYQKSKLATENGYHCIHIWDWDDKNKILNIFKQKEKIQGRKTEVKEISIQEADNFNNLYHLQNTCRGQKVIYGLYHKNQLISLMSFGEPRYNKNYQYELLRYTTHPDYMILGGAEKLFKHFIKEINPESIITYCDYSKFSGQVYKKLGFKFVRHNRPSCHWIRGTKRITQAQLNKYGFDKLLGKEYGYYGIGTNNEFLMLQSGFVKLYDCGQLVFDWYDNV